MGLFSNLFGGRKKEGPGADQTQALRKYLEEKLPASYVKSPMYAVSIAEKGEGYTARITLDMRADGSDYSGFADENYAELSELESSYVFDTFLTDPPARMEITFDMVFGADRTIEKEMGWTPLK